MADTRHTGRYRKQINRQTDTHEYRQLVNTVVNSLRRNYKETTGIKEDIDPRLFKALTTILEEKAPRESSIALMKRVFGGFLQFTPDRPQMSLDYYTTGPDSSYTPLSLQEARNRDIYFVNGIDSGSESYESFYATARGKYYQKIPLIPSLSDFPANLEQRVCGIRHLHTIQSRFELVEDTQHEKPGDYLPAHRFAEEVLYPQVKEHNSLNKIFFNHSMGGAFTIGAQNRLTELLRRDGLDDTEIQKIYSTSVVVNIGYALNPRRTGGPCIPEINVIRSNDIAPYQLKLITPDCAKGQKTDSFLFFRTKPARIATRLF